jgi:hypothetical protein
VVGKRAKACTDGNEQSIARNTCFLVGKYVISSLERYLWLTARHGDVTRNELVVGDQVSIYLNAKRTLVDCECIFVNEESDIAVISSDVIATIPDILSFGHIYGSIQEVLFLSPPHFAVFLYRLLGIHRRLWRTHCC